VASRAPDRDGERCAQLRAAARAGQGSDAGGREGRIVRSRAGARFSDVMLANRIVCSPLSGILQRGGTRSRTILTDEAANAVQQIVCRGDPGGRPGR